MQAQNMELEFTLIICTCLALFLISLISKRSSKKQQQQTYHLPPTPSPPLPVIGHLHLLTTPLTRTFQKISQKHGPIFTLKIGSRRVVVVSSPQLVAECFTSTNDVIFSNRPRGLIDDHTGYDRSVLPNAPYGPLWRRLRRLAAAEVFSPGRLDVFAHIRRDEIRRTLVALIDPSNREHANRVELRPRMFELFFNIMTRMLRGKRYSSEEKESERFRELIDEFFENAHAWLPEDYIPILRWIDCRGMNKKLALLGKKMDEFYQGLIEEHRREKRVSIIGHLLSLQESDPQSYSDTTIKGFITSMMVASTDTSVVSLEWTMSLLLNHPQVLQKAKAELDSKVGPHRLLEEQDLPNLPYLRNIVLESSRIFPAGPLGLPRESSADCKVGGYDVPRGSTLIVNTWAIHRDPEVWAEPMTFSPERFEGKVVETQTLMTFGMGRRSCPGTGMAHRMIGLTLGSFIQCFDWERVSLEEVDLTESVGLSMPKLNPLEAMCKPREIMLKVLEESVLGGFTS